MNYGYNPYGAKHFSLDFTQFTQVTSFTHLSVNVDN
jgi:hypothetical protein